MRQLTVVRHAKSSWDDPGLSDFERPLNDRGQRDAPRMAVWTRQAVGVPDAIVSSPALRALTTARLFAVTLGIDVDHLLIQNRVYEASLPTLLRMVRGFDDRYRHIMLFGHNPGLSELVHALARCPFDQLPTCAVVQIEFGIKQWSEAAEHDGHLLRYQFPKQLRD
ncbi:SixA phosphatase family protein [Solimonas soli]|uniref:SixA phosphatase family protein n=1 Tax=Solimonas soli TaxID=413479 RepID=UPI0004825936|nr:histidine phosphatase family protein [Solimonas soli]